MRQTGPLEDISGEAIRRVDTQGHTLHNAMTMSEQPISGTLVLID